MFPVSFRNIPHQQVRRGSRGHGVFPPQQICFKSMSTSCEAKCASFFWMRRLVSKMSADQLSSLLQAKLVCVSERQEEGLDTADVHTGCWKRCGKKDTALLIYAEEAEGKGQSQFGFGWTGDDCTLECRCDTWMW